MQITGHTPMQARSAAPKSLQELYDQRQQELETGVERFEQLAGRAATAHTYGLYGMSTLFAGLGSTVAGGLTKLPVLQYAGIGLTVAGLAVFAPAMWIRDSAGMEASFQRMENNALAQAQRELKEDLAPKK